MNHIIFGEGKHATDAIDEIKYLFVKYMCIDIKIMSFKQLTFYT